MSDCIVQVKILSTAIDAVSAARLSECLAKSLTPLVERCVAVAQAPLTPEVAANTEQKLQHGLREVGRELWSFTLNRLAQAEELPPRVRIGHDEYRRRPPSRLRLSTLFGVVNVSRFLLEPLQEGERCIFPFDLRLGVEAGHVSAPLAEKIARLAANCTQSEVREQLRTDHRAELSVDRLRRVVASISEAVVPFIQPAQVALLLRWLEQAERSTGRHRPTLAVGRDGCDLPILHEHEYKVGSVATVSVLDRRGKRLGTIYLGVMPEAGQTTLTRQLTALLQAVLLKSATVPRLVYLTDGGYHETSYFRTLRQMRHPRTGDRLTWERVIDFFHVCEYVTRLGEVLFGKGRRASAWAHKMRHWLRDKPNGACRVIHSAAAHCVGRYLTKKEEKEYRTCLNYLRRRIRLADYHGLRKRGLPIGSGITEAACKIVFTQRFKRSGMKWLRESGQHVLTLRTLTLSGIWPAVYQNYLRHRAEAIPDALNPGTNATISAKPMRKAA